MQPILLVRYGEIFLKWLNRPYFMRALVHRVQQAVSGLHAHAVLHDGRILVTGCADAEEAAERVTKVFGVHSVCPAVEMDKDDFEAIAAEAVRLMDGLSGTFRVTARRSDKTYPMDSPEICMELGHRILQQRSDLTVDLHQPQHVLNVEIRDKAYLYVRVIPAVGGMPVGTGGRAALLLSGGIDSPVAGWMIAKRGVELSAVHFHSFPYTSERAKEKVLDLARILAGYCGPIRVHVVPFTHIQTEIHEKCPEEYTTLIMRCFMMRIAQACAEQDGCQALITGESLGQVASQTMEALGATNSVVTLPVFRPLIGFDKSEIISVAERIGTYETSCLPYEDCCTVFTPKHPATKPKMEKLIESEKHLDGEALIAEALAGVEHIRV